MELRANLCPHGSAWWRWAAMCGAAVMVLVSHWARSDPQFPGPYLYVGWDWKEKNILVVKATFIESASNNNHFDFYQLRWGSKGGGERQARIGGRGQFVAKKSDSGVKSEVYVAEWNQTLSAAPGDTLVFKVQTCKEPDYVIDGSTCSRWTEVELLLPKAPSDVSLADESGWDGQRYVYRYRLSWRPGVGVVYQLVAWRASDWVWTELPVTATENVITLDPADPRAKQRTEFEFMVCGRTERDVARDLRPATDLTPASLGREYRETDTICADSVRTRKQLPLPRKPSIKVVEEMADRVRLGWVAGDNITDKFEIERLHLPSPSRLVAVQGNGVQDMAGASQGRAQVQQPEAGTRQGEAFPIVGSVSRPRPDSAGGKDDRVWVKFDEVASNQYDLFDMPERYSKLHHGAPYEPYTYRVCALNASGRTCSDSAVLAVTALRFGRTKAAASSPLAQPANAVPAASLPAAAVSDDHGKLSGQSHQQTSDANRATQSRKMVQQKMASDTSATKRMEPSTNRLGGDYTNRQLASAEQCRAACVAEAQCRSWTWVKPGVQGPNANCWLKNQVPPESSNDCCVSGVK